MNNESKEFLLKDNDRDDLFPIIYQDVWKFYEKAEESFWRANSIPYSDDLNDFKKLSNDEKFFIENVLAFFASSDKIVNANLRENFTTQISIPEVQQFYDLQVAMENIHTQTYHKLINAFVTDSKKRTHLFGAIKNIDSIKKKAEWAYKWIHSGTFVERLIAFAFVEGVFFSGAFCSIFWLKNRGLMTKALGVSNEYISRDEGMHTDFACLLYTKYVSNKLSKERIYEIATEACNCEIEFITESLPVKLIGMNSEHMIQYIKFVTDRLLRELGYDKLYNVENPFEWMKTISTRSKTNFFEKHVTEYKKPNNISLNRSEDLI